MGYRIGRFDLSSGNLEVVHVPDDLLRAYIGGSGLAAALLFPVLTPELDPLSPEAPLLIATGPLTGTRGPAVGRYTICGKSPATGLWGESNIGGSGGPALRSAGFDGLWITGRSEIPVYLWVTSGSIMIRSAEHLWGITDTYQTQLALKAELPEPKASVLTIGIAGENQLPFALIVSDHGRVAGRTGMGAIMGSKNLKAIAIRGREPIPIVSNHEFSRLRTKVNRELRVDLVSEGLRDFGTAIGSDVFNYFGMMPKCYFSSGTLEGTDKVSGPSLSETILSGVSTCHGCVIACGRKVKLDDGIERKGPEYETTMGFGPNLGITDLSAITLMGERCDQLGMDTISFSTILGMTIFLYENGYLGMEDTGGVELNWGDPQLVSHMIDATAKREGFGARLALGARRLAAELNASEFAAEVKGLELPFHDPRGASGVALVYSTSPRGACHNQSHYYLVELGQTIEEIGVDFLDRMETTRKPTNVARHQDWTSVLNSLVMCIFANVPVSEIVELVNLVNGWEYSVDDVMTIGERIWNLKRLINANLGAILSDDGLPAHLMTSLDDGGAAGFTPPLEEMLERYYDVRGWDQDSGLPTRPTIKRLGLDAYSSGQLLARKR